MRGTWTPRPANLIAGPPLTAAQLLPYDTFQDSSSVIHLDGGYAHQPVTVRLYALNYRVPTSGLPVIVTLPWNLVGEPGPAFLLGQQAALADRLHHAVRHQDVPGSPEPLPLLV